MRPGVEQPDLEDGAGEANPDGWEPFAYSDSRLLLRRCIRR